MNPQPLRAVVTGASSGIGRQIAIELAQQACSSLAGLPVNSHRLVIHYRNNLEGARTTAREVESLGVATEIVQADICEPTDREALVDRAWGFLDAPTTWINNAGADVLTGEIGDWSFLDKLRLLLETDVLGTIELSRRVAERMRADWSSDDETELIEPPPSITFIGWDQAPLGMEGDAGQMFGPVKAAVMAFASSLAQELAPGIRVNTIAPGWIKTAWGETTDSYWDRRATDQALMRRWGTPKDVAKAVCFVADPLNTFCTGQTIRVNGGWNRTARRG